MVKAPVVRAGAWRLPVASGALHGPAAKQRRRRLRDAALIGSCLLLIPYWPPPPNLFVTSFEQFIVFLLHTL